MTLLDYGTNVCLLGQDLRFIRSLITQRFVNIIGTRDHLTSGKLIDTAIRKVFSNLGFVVIITHEKTYVPE